MADYLTFQDLYTELQRLLKVTKGSKLAYSKMMLNMVYLNEIMRCDDLYPLFWMVDFDDTKLSVAPATISGITAADPGVITTAAVHGLTVGDIVACYNIVGTTELNDRILRVNTTPSPTTLTLIDLDANDAIDTTGYTAWSSGGTIHHRGFPLATTNRDVQRILHCKWHDEGKLLPITPYELEDKNAWMSDGIARPTRYLQRKRFLAAGTETNHLIWFQGADAAYRLRYWCEMRANKLVATTDVPLLPPEFHHAIVAGAAARMAEFSIEVENQQVWAPTYANQIDAIRDFNRSHWEQYKNIEEFKKPFLL
jgi:hypothetical protein